MQFFSMNYFLPPLLSERCCVIHYTESIFSPRRWLTHLFFNRCCWLNLIIFAPVLLTTMDLLMSHEEFVIDNLLEVSKWPCSLSLIPKGGWLMVAGRRLYIAGSGWKSRVQAGYRGCGFRYCRWEKLFCVKFKLDFEVTE